MFVHTCLSPHLPLRPVCVKQAMACSCLLISHGQQGEALTMEWAPVCPAEGSVSAASSCLGTQFINQEQLLKGRRKKRTLQRCIFFSISEGKIPSCFMCTGKNDFGCCHVKQRANGSEKQGCLSNYSLGFWTD